MKKLKTKPLNKIETYHEDMDNEPVDKPNKDFKISTFIILVILFVAIIVGLSFIKPPTESVNVTQKCCDSFCNKMLNNAGVCHSYTQLAMFCAYNETLISQYNESMGTTPLFEFYIYNSTKTCGE